MRDIEHQLYTLVAQQIENGEIDKGIWTYAYSKAEGDKRKAEAIYIQTLVDEGLKQFDALDSQSKKKDSAIQNLISSSKKALAEIDLEKTLADLDKWSDKQKEDWSKEFASFSRFKQARYYIVWGSFGILILLLIFWL